MTHLRGPSAQLDDRRFCQALGDDGSRITSPQRVVALLALSDDGTESYDWENAVALARGVVGAWAQRAELAALATR